MKNPIVTNTQEKGGSRGGKKRIQKTRSTKGGGLPLNHLGKNTINNNIFEKKGESHLIAKREWREGRERGGKGNSSLIEGGSRHKKSFAERSREKRKERKHAKSELWLRPFKKKVLSFLEGSKVSGGGWLAWKNGDYPGDFLGKLLWVSQEKE